MGIANLNRRVDSVRQFAAVFRLPPKSFTLVKKESGGKIRSRLNSRLFNRKTRVVALARSKVRDRNLCYLGLALDL